MKEIILKEIINLAIWWKKKMKTQIKDNILNQDAYKQEID